MMWNGLYNIFTKVLWFECVSSSQISRLALSAEEERCGILSNDPVMSTSPLQTRRRPSGKRPHQQLAFPPLSPLCHGVTWGPLGSPGVPLLAHSSKGMGTGPSADIQPHSVFLLDMQAPRF